jgi:hypothetical protein
VNATSSAAPSKGRPAFEATDSGFHFKVPKVSAGKRAWLWIGVVVLALAAFGAWWLREDPVLTGVPFVVRNSTDGNSWSVRFVVDQIKFFEGPTDPPRQRSYGTTFTSAQTRYIYTELTFRFAAPGRSVVLPVGCTIYSAADAVVGSFTIQSTIEANATQWFNTRAWGAERPGTWRAGRYRVACSYGDKLVARGTFQVIE